MKRPNRRVLLYSACLFVFATIAAWPSTGWSRTARHTCDVNKIVRERLENWAARLKESWEKNNPTLIVSTYAGNGVLLPTCANGPLAGREAISGYFVNDFLPLHPEATFDWNSLKVGGDCAQPVGSGLYGFKSSKGPLQARFTYVLRQTGPDTWLIAQHHSSLQPKPASACPSH